MWDVGCKVGERRGMQDAERKMQEMPSLLACHPERSEWASVVEGPRQGYSFAPHFRLCQRSVGAGRNSQAC